MKTTLVLGLAVFGCDAASPSRDMPADDPGGKADEASDVDEVPCQDVDGLPNGLVDVLRFDDPIARAILRSGASCPTTYGEMLDKLRTTDVEECETVGADLVSRVVSDDARLHDGPANFRTVTTRACGGREPFELVWTLLGVRADEDMASRDFVEIMAFDRDTELFNYYRIIGGRWTFEGTSLDVLAGNASCNACHQSGGIIMKELDEPWVHWESDDFHLPGADALFAAHGDLMGTRGDARGLESVVRAGNERMNLARIEHHRDPAVGSIEALLRPLFCPLEMNFDTAGTRPHAPVTGIPFDFLVDPVLLDESGGIAMSPEIYDQTIRAANQRVPGLADVLDTAFAFVFPERAGVDLAYVRQLTEAGIVDEDFAADVLAVDFTRPLYSDARCDLLRHAPEHAELETLTPAALREAFLADLQGAAAGSPGAELAASLADPGDLERHRADAAAFVSACEQRPEAEFMADALETAHALREHTRTLPIIEHPAQMPRTDLSGGLELRFDPTTCELAR